MNSKNIFRLWPFAFFLFLIYLSGCLNTNDDDIINPITGEGPVVEMPIVVDSFNQVNHVAVGNLSILISDTFSVVLKAQQNILDLMDWTVEDETFYWGYKVPVNIIESEEILCEINLPVEIESVTLTGIGVIKIEGPKQDIVYLEVIGLGNINAFGLEVDKAEVMLSGSGNIQVKVIDEITGVLSGNGNVYYRGDPVLNVYISGNGTVIKDN